MSMKRVLAAGTVALALALAAMLATSTVAAQTSNDKNSVVKVLVKSSGPRMDTVVSGLSREWARKRGSVEMVRREAEADLVVTLGSRRRGGNVSLILTGRFGPRSESFGGDDFGYLVEPLNSDDFGFSPRPDVTPDRLGGDDFGYLVDKADAWLTKNRARVLAVRR